MDKDRIKGKIKEVEGRLQDAKGDLTGNPMDDIKRTAKQVEGKVQQAVGKMRDDARKSRDRV